MVSESREFFLLGVGGVTAMRSLGRGLDSGSDKVEENEVNEEDEPELRGVCDGGGEPTSDIVRDGGVRRQTLSMEEVGRELADCSGGVGSGR